MRPRLSPRRAAGALAGLLLAALAAPAVAQSGDANFPTPLFSNVVAGSIAPRDVGDPRRTRHFYLFRGTEGDLTVTLESSNLSGDVDVFTARSLRPLLKITLFGGAATNATKSVYLRTEETLVLRVEARAAGEAEGSYRLTLGGSFAPAPASLADSAPPPQPEVSSEGRRGRGTRRVTSTGARIEEPTPAPEPAREEADAAEEAKAAPPQPGRETSPPAEAEKPAAGESGARTTARTRNTRRGRAAADRARGRRTPPAWPEAEVESGAKGEETTSAARAGEAEPAEGAAAEPARPAPRPRGRRTGRPRGSAERAPASRTGASSDEAVAAPAAPAAPPQRLVIVTKDGETFERDMTAVRRVTVENNQVVVTTKDGKTTRRPLAEVLKMSIEPQP